MAKKCRVPLGLLPPSAPNKQYFSVAYTFFSYFNFISNTRSFIQKGEQLHEEAEVRHNTSGSGAQCTELHCEEGGEAREGSDENGGLRGIQIANFHFLPRLAIQWVDYSVVVLFLLFVLATSLFFSDITERSAKAGDIPVPFVSLSAWTGKGMETRSRK